VGEAAEQNKKQESLSLQKVKLRCTKHIAKELTPTGVNQNLVALLLSVWFSTWAFTQGTAAITSKSSSVFSNGRLAGQLWSTHHPAERETAIPSTPRLLPSPHHGTSPRVSDSRSCHSRDSSISRSNA